MKWIKIFPSSSKAMELIPETKPFTVAIGALHVIFLKRKGRLVAFKAVCPHAGASLSEGFVNGDWEIVCPLHGYRFSLWDGKEATGKKCELEQYAIDIRDEGVFLRMP